MEAPTKSDLYAGVEQLQREVASSREELERLKGAGKRLGNLPSHTVDYEDITAFAWCVRGPSDLDLDRAECSGSACRFRVQGGPPDRVGDLRPARPSMGPYAGVDPGRVENSWIYVVWPEGQAQACPECGAPLELSEQVRPKYKPPVEGRKPGRPAQALAQWSLAGRLRCGARVLRCAEVRQATRWKRRLRSLRRWLSR